jgi:hypothetical protein
MKVIRGGGEFAAVLRLINESTSSEEVAEHLKGANLGAEAEAALAAVVAGKRQGQGVIRSEQELAAAVSGPALERLARYAVKLSESVKLEPTRQHFEALLLSNPNYFGTIEGATQPPVAPMKGNTTYEELTCVGLNTPIDRLEAVLQIKKSAGYSGGICTNGSIEWMRFFVDLHDNGVFHDVGLGWVRVYDIGGTKPLCYAIYKDFAPIRKRCTAENVVKVRAILSWNTQPQPNNPNYSPIWGSVMDVMVQIRPRFFIDFGELVTEVLKPVPIPDPIGPVIKQIDPKIKLPLALSPAMAFAEKKKLYLQNRVPMHRVAFPEVQHLLTAKSVTATQIKTSPLISLGLTEAEIGDLLGKLQAVTDGDTSFEELKCVGIKPEKDMLEAVFTMKKKFGYSGSLCTEGSTEYVAFWIDFNDGGGFTYIDTAALEVHDLTEVGAAGIQYAVYVKKDLFNHLTPCEAGARIVRLRAILSWQVPPPPGNPNWVPIWGNREECRIQLRPGEGKLATILEVDDVATDDISTVTGRANGSFVEGNSTFDDAPFGVTITIAGTIGLGTDFLGGAAAQFKYRFEVKRDDGIATYEPVINTFQLKKVQRNGPFVIQCEPGETICEFNQAPLPAAGEGGESGWYLYHEDLIGLLTQEILSDVLMKWPTDPSMEGRWKARLHVKDSLNNHYFSDEVTIRIDNTAPEAVLTLTSATLNGNPLPALECGKFPVGTVLSGTFAAHDPGTSSSAADFQHYRTASLTIHPAGPANGVTPTTNPTPLDYNPPAILTVGVNGTWELKTKGMSPCGYVLRLDVRDRTITDVGHSEGFHNADEFGFCLE